MSRPSGLGRGLSALIPATTVSGSGAEEESDHADAADVAVLHPEGVPELAELEMVLVSDIHPNRYQPRTVFDRERLSDLTASIKEVRVLQPVLLRRMGERYELVAGERRCKGEPTEKLVDRIHDLGQVASQCSVYLVSPTQGKK